MKDELVKQALDDMENGQTLSQIQNRFKLLADHYVKFGEAEMANTVARAWLDVIRLAPPSFKLAGKARQKVIFET